MTVYPSKNRDGHDNTNAWDRNWAGLGLPVFLSVYSQFVRKERDFAECVCVSNQITLLNAYRLVHVLKHYEVLKGRVLEILQIL
jgi:hypothetical protein